MIDFPVGTDGLIFSAPNGVVYKYSATYSSWLAQNAAPAIGGTGEVTASSISPLSLTGSTQQILFPSVQSGNGSGWWSVSTNRYTPPAGKYFLQCSTNNQAPSGGNGTVSISLRKNGTAVNTISGSGSASFNIPVTLGEYVDANGSDFFDWAVVGTSGAQTIGAIFSAFPLTGMQGPTGGAPGSVVGDFSAATGTLAVGGLAPVIMPVTNGNSGGYYNAANGRWTPPAGRYNFYGSMGFYRSDAGIGGAVSLRKNGVVVGTTANATSVGANQWGVTCNETQVDANGSDYFEMWCSVTLGTSGAYGYMGGYPIQGMVGPQGPPGNPPTAGGGIIREVTLASPAATIDLFSLGVKSAQIVFHLIPTTGTPAINMSSALSSVIDASSNYRLQSLGASGSTPSAILGAVSTLIAITSCDAGQVMNGHMIFPNIGGGRGQSTFSTWSGGVFYLFHHAYILPTGTDGFRFSLSSGNFAAGSFVRVIGWP